MNCCPIHRRSVLITTFTALVGLSLAMTTQARVLDDFNDNTKTGWSDFSFAPPYGIPQEQNGQYRFEIPKALQDQVKGIFSASTKSSETFTLKEGRTVEFRVDVVSGGAKDSFAVLSWIPVNPQGPSRLQGYSVAKSTTDVLIVKGINKYFVAASGEAANLKQDNITLVLNLTVKGGNVLVHSQVLDKDSNNKVLWESSVIDTPDADIMEDGVDDPKAPFLGEGNFVLYLYADYDASAVEDPYVAVFDNAEVYVTETSVLDDFNDNTKTAWADFSFTPPYGIPTEQNGQFRFEIPAAVQSQAKGIFSASTKNSRTFDLVEGERVEFAVDVVQGGAKDSFAVLSWIPVNPQGPSRLQGYSLAKSTTDVLIVKGINKYFVADNGAGADLKQEDITLGLSLTVKNGSVIVHAQVLDKADKNKIIWERTIVDTADADLMEDGVDDPKAPFLGSGNFVLYLYADYDAGAIEDPYLAVYDNAVVSAPPPPANTAPIISEVAPNQNAIFQPVTTAVTFKAADDKALVDEKLSISLNGSNYTTLNGLIVSGSGTSKTVTLSGKLQTNVNYKAVMRVEDSEGLATTNILYFDTFVATDFVVEIEDYNFDNGNYINNPVPVYEGGFQDNSYSYQTGYQDVDFSDTRTAPSGDDTLYRPNDPIRMQHTRDYARAKFESAGGAANSVFDYDVGDIATGEWLNYTRNFASGSYEVYLREGLANMASGESVLELVTGDRTQPNAATKVLGSFLGELTGFQYRCFPLTDGSGLNKIVVNLDGVTTLRLRHVTPDTSGAARSMNYLVFVPTAASGLQRALIASLSPPADATVETVSPVIQVVIQNRDTSVKTDTITLKLNGATVNPVITPQTTGALVRYPILPLPVSDAVNHAEIAFKDSDNVTISTEWNFTVSYRSLNAANAQTGPGLDRGLKARMVQAPAGSNLESSLARAEEQLATNSTIPVYVATNFIAQVINMAQDDQTSGYFTAPEYTEMIVPGLDESNGTDDFSVEINCWLELSAGAHRFGVKSDDGYKVSSGASPSDKEPVLGQHSGGTADETFDFVAPVAGFYPFRLIWYERGGDAILEWFSVNLATGERTLINEAASSQAVKAYQDAVLSPVVPAVKVQSSTNVATGYADDATAVIDSTAKRITVPLSGSVKFYRLAGAKALKIKSAQIQGANFVMTYE
jgi:hypothetical protein